MYVQHTTKVSLKPRVWGLRSSRLPYDVQGKAWVDDRATVEIEWLSLMHRVNSVNLVGEHK